MLSEIFIVAFHNGHWQIGFAGQWHGPYPNREAAVRMAVRFAMQMGELPTQVVVRGQDGSDKVVWQPVPPGCLPLAIDGL
jgi:hypothetical protein